jgi:hypothetical protein
MVSKFIINGKILRDLILGSNENYKLISGMLSYDGKTLQFLNCETMEIRLTQKVKPVDKEKALFKSKEFRNVTKLGNDDYLVVIKDDVIEFYSPEETDFVLFEIKGGNLV